MSNHHFHPSAGPFTILLFYYFISIRFQAEVFASRVAKPECRTTIFTGRPAVFASRVAKPECRTTIFTGRPAAFSRRCFASRTAFFACRLTFFACRPNVSPTTLYGPNHWPEPSAGIVDPPSLESVCTPTICKPKANAQTYIYI